MSFIDRIRTARDFDARRFRPFLVAGKHCGWVRPAFVKQLARWPEVFAINAKSVSIAESLDSPESRSNAVAPILCTLRDEGLIQGWRNETYTVAADFGEPPLLIIERAAARPFGIRTRGAHLNGIMGKATDCKMWIARRAADKPIDPSMLDNLVGGGVGFGFSPLETIRKECFEEAGISDELAQRVEAKSVVTLLQEVPDGVHWEALYTFDLELTEAFQPVNHDGEVAEFRLLPIRDVRRLIRDTAEFTPDAALVVLDFLLRQEMSATTTSERAKIDKLLRETPDVKA